MGLNMMFVITEPDRRSDVGLQCGCALKQRHVMKAFCQPVSSGGARAT